MVEANDLSSVTLRLSGIVSESVVDGVGFRMTIFTQGCKHGCKGCHNPQTHPLDGGEVTDLRFILDEIDKDPLLDGITLSGGEPFLQPAPLALLCEKVHARGLNVWCYTGYTYEQLDDLAATKKDVAALLDQVDVLVDGRFEQEKSDLTLKFRGSSNQRILDMPATRAAGFPVWLKDMK